MSIPDYVLGQDGEGLIVTPVKKVIIQALRQTFTSMYPNTKMSDLNIDLEYPYKEEHYPGIWVRFSPTVVRAAGINPYERTEEELFVVWYFEGVVNLNIAAFTSKERDLISDGFVEAYAFAKMMPHASTFYSTISSSDLVNMSLDQDQVTPGGQTEHVGVPWQDDKIVYDDRYSFNVIGQVRSRVDPDNVFLPLAEIQTFANLTNAPGAADNSIGDDGDGVWQ